MTVFAVLSALVILGVLVWGVTVVSERAAQETAREFAGEVVDRQHKEVTLTTGMRHDYYLVVQSDDGRTLTCPVNGTVYGRFAVGDRIVKRAGERWPAKGEPVDPAG